ncbi:MAG: DUF4331 family protein [Chloroflexota bacterium]
MKKMVICLLLSFLVLSSFPATPAFASDHADPMNLGAGQVDSGLTDLFVFPDGEHMVVILNVHRALTQPPPFNLEPFTYRIHMDLHTEVTYDDAEALARFGGTIASPEGISSDVTIELQLNNDTSVMNQSIDGLTNTDGIELWTGIRDDPFIFPNFFGTNVVAIVMRIPMASFPEGQQDWLVWATSHKGDTQIDHVGRSNRTMLPRFEALNTTPPNEHVAKITQIHDDPNLLEDITGTYIMPLFEIRAYDFVPDVMIYTTRSPAGFPNGRLLTDDVVKLTCEYGDCLPFQLSFNSTGPRPTTNDKEFLSEFPYLAEPWPDMPPEPAPSLSTKNKIIAGLIGLGLLVFIILENWLVAVLYHRRKVAKGG